MSHSYKYFEEHAPKIKMRASEFSTFLKAQQNEAIDFSVSTSKYYQKGAETELLNSSSHSMTSIDFLPEASIVLKAQESPYGSNNVNGFPHVAYTVHESCESPHVAYTVRKSCESPHKTYNEWKRESPRDAYDMYKSWDSTSANMKYSIYGRNTHVIHNFDFNDSRNNVENMNSSRQKRLFSSTELSEDEDEGKQKKRIRDLEKYVNSTKKLCRKEKQKREKERKLVEATLEQKEIELQAANSSILELREEVSSLSRERENDRALIESLKKENIEVRKRNDDLQDCVINYVKSKGSYSREADKENENTMPVFQVGTISLPQRDIELINKQEKPSLFVKELMNKLWSREELTNRSLTGNPCPRKKHFGGSPNPPLTPEKVEFMRELYKIKLKTLGRSEKDWSGELTLFKKYVAEKLYDIQKAETNRRLKLESRVGS